MEGFKPSNLMGSISYAFLSNSLKLGYAAFSLLASLSYAAAKALYQVCSCLTSLLVSTKATNTRLAHNSVACRMREKVS